MNLSPTVRTILIIVAAVAGALTGVGAAIGVPAIVISIAGVLTAALAGLGIVPPQVGGTQQGVVNPSVVEPPKADVVQAPPVVNNVFNGEAPDPDAVIERYSRGGPSPL